MDLQKIVDSLNEQGARERGNYHLTFGQLIEALKKAEDTDRITPKITGISAYRGYYSDIALNTENVGTTACYLEDCWDKESVKELRFEIEELSEVPSVLAEQLESLLGKYFDGYKGGCNLITLDKPLWIASDYGDCSDKEIVGITSDLQLLIKEID